MPSTYTLIKGETLTGSAASYSFTAIPSTFTDLCLRVSSRTDAGTANDNLQITFNSDSGANYSMTRLTGTGSAASSNRTSSANAVRVGWTDGASGTASTFGSMEVYIPSYLSSSTKPLSSIGLAEQNATAANINAIAGLVPTTAAVSSLTLTSLGDNFVAGSSFYLYGIKNS